MDAWKYYDITHRNQPLCNPMGAAKLDLVLSLLDLPPKASVLDIACGKGELLVRLAELHDAATARGIHGVGVDISPPFVATARSEAGRRAPGADLSFVEMDAAQYRPDAGAHDLACCVGGTFALGGYGPALTVLRDAARPGGQLLIGEAFWRTAPEPEYLVWSGMTADQFTSHAGNVEIAAAMGLTPMLALVSNADEWDAYETLHWYSAALYESEHPDDPDLPELRQRIERARHEYLTWGRETLGWALYLFRTAAA